MTAADRYLVRPNIGIIQGNATEVVKVEMQREVRNTLNVVIFQEQEISMADVTVLRKILREKFQL